MSQHRGRVVEKRKIERRKVTERRALDATIKGLADRAGRKKKRRRRTRLPPTRSFVTPHCRRCRSHCRRLLSGVTAVIQSASRDRQYVTFVQTGVPRSSQWRPRWTPASTCVCTALNRGLVGTSAFFFFFFFRLLFRFFFALSMSFSYHRIKVAPALPYFLSFLFLSLFFISQSFSCFNIPER